MKTIHTIPELRKELAYQHKHQQKIGFVPTMGYLHAGHQSLINQARHDCDIVVVSIFVNPLQFAPTEDLSTYPRDFAHDSALCNKAQVDYLFVPDAKELLSNHEQMLTFVDIEKLSDNLCGRSRPGHFRGVLTMVVKLFNIVRPDYAYFGQKDIQQLVIIQTVCQELNISVTIVPCAIVRNDLGVALSSRNSYLSNEQLQCATVIPRTLSYIKTQLAAGISDVNTLISQASAMLLTQVTKIDYVEIVDGKQLQLVEGTNLIQGQEYVFAVAVYIATTRLIDNLLFVFGCNTEFLA